MVRRHIPQWMPETIKVLIPSRIHILETDGSSGTKSGVQCALGSAGQQVTYYLERDGAGWYGMCELSS